MEDTRAAASASDDDFKAKAVRGQLVELADHFRTSIHQGRISASPGAGRTRAAVLSIDAGAHRWFALVRARRDHAAQMSESAGKSHRA
jgi:hypothetical protein